MLDHFVIDWNKSFGKGIFLGVEPKMVRSDKLDPKSPQIQDRDKEGLLKWTATIAVRIQNFEKVKTENIAITLKGKDKPCAALPIGQTVGVEDLELGIMKQDRGGFSIFFSAAGVRPVQQQVAAAS